MTNKKRYEAQLPYHKQGDDLHAYLNHPEYMSLPEHLRHATALEGHADMLNGAAKMLRELAVLAKEGKLLIDQADTHWIVVMCDENEARKLEYVLHEMPEDEEPNEDETDD